NRFLFIELTWLYFVLLWLQQQFLHLLKTLRIYAQSVAKITFKRTPAFINGGKGRLQIFRLRLSQSCHNLRGDIATNLKRQITAILITEHVVFNDGVPGNAKC